MKLFTRVSVFVAILFIMNAKCQETEEIRRRRQNGVFFGLSGLDSALPFDLDAFFEQAAPTKTTAEVTKVSRPQRAFTTTTTTPTTTESPPVRKPSVNSDGVSLRLFNTPSDDRQFEQQPTFQQETPFVSRGNFQQEPRDFQQPGISDRRRPEFFTSRGAKEDRTRDNLRERIPASPVEGSPESFRPVQTHHRPIAAFDFSSLDPVQPEAFSQDDRFRPQQANDRFRSQQTSDRFRSQPQQTSDRFRSPSQHDNSFRSFAPSAENDGSLEVTRPVRPVTELNRPRFTEDDRREHHHLSNKPEQLEPITEPVPPERNEFRTPFPRESTESRPEFENPRQFDLHQPSGRDNFEDDGQGRHNNGDVFEEEIKDENPQNFQQPSAEIGFDDEFQSTEGDVGGSKEQFPDDGRFQENNSEETPREEGNSQPEQPQEVQPQFHSDGHAPVEKEQVRNFQSASPDDHSNFPESFIRAPLPRLARPTPQHFSAGSPQTAPVSIAQSTPPARVSNPRHFPSTIPVGDLNRDRSADSRQPSSSIPRRQEFDARAVRKPFQEANSFSDPQTFHTAFRNFAEQPEEDRREFRIPSRPTRPSVRLETTGQISPSFVRVTEPTDFSAIDAETEVSADGEFTSNRISASTRRPIPPPSTRRTTTAKPLRRKNNTRRPVSEPTLATSFESPSSASVARPSEATTTSFRFPLRDRSRSSASASFIRNNNRIFNNGASATENTIDDSFSPGFTIQAVSRGDSRGSGPTPVYGQMATTCDHSACQLPRCFCGGNQIMPGNLRPEEIPQIVILTFDDAVNDLNWKLYTRLFFQKRKNPNGCPIKSTFYVSHEWTDYSKVQNLYAAGHEIASHSISHGDGRDYSKKKWYNEIYGQREILSVYANVDIDDIKGMRSPFLAMGGDKQFSMLYETNFTYESSMTVTDVHPPYWPYTLDYAVPHRCAIPPCPRQSYPGFWEIPMVALTDLNGGKCSMADSCSFATTEDGIYDMLIKNFERHYRSNRAPFGLYYHASWFLIPHRQEGFVKFLDEILQKDDVYLVTALQALEWIKNPTPLNDIKRFEPWGCNQPPKGVSCQRPKSCELRFKGDTRYMSTCNSCPNVYPWVGDTGITKHKHTLISN